MKQSCQQRENGAGRLGGRRRFGVIFLCVALSMNSLFAAFQDPFWSSRVASLSGVYTAVSDDATGIFYNPAAAVRKIEQKESNFMVAKLLTGLDGVNLSLYQTSYVHPIGKSSLLGAGWGNFTANRLYKEETFLLSFARNVSDLIFVSGAELSLGASLKYLVRSFTLNENSAQDPVFKNKQRRGALAVDMHAAINPAPRWLPDLSLGVTVRSLNRPNVGIQSTDELPREVLIGLAYRWNNFLIPVDFALRNDTLDIRFGSELAFFHRHMALRLGSDTNRLGSGFGFEIDFPNRFSLLLDYAFLLAIQEGDRTGGSHRLTLGMKF